MWLSLCGQLLMGRFSQWTICVNAIFALWIGVVCVSTVGNLLIIYFFIVRQLKVCGPWCSAFSGLFE